MASHDSNFSHLFVITFLVTAVGSTIMEKVVVEGDTCSQSLGDCGGDCDQRCKAVHGGGQGSCDSNICTCNYYCPPPTPTPPERKCDGGFGFCTSSCMDDCCNSKCAVKYSQGIGWCNNVDGYNFCYCEYVCS